MITNHNAELMARSDAGFLHERKPERYVQLNRYQYYTLCNTWVLMIKAHNAVAAAILERYLLNHGLLSTIADAQHAATAIIEEKAITNPSFAMMATGLDVEDALQIFRFPKRFSPLSDSLKDQTIASFKEQLTKAARINKRQRGSGNRFIIESVRIELSEMLKTYECDFSSIYLTDGISAENYTDKTSYKTVYEKVAHLARPNYFGFPYYSTGSMPRITYPNGRADFDVKRFGTVARVSSVPKSYKTYRTIAVEPVDKQSDQQCIRAALEEALYISVGDHAPIHDQAMNGTLAQDQRYATIDLHAASDSLTWWLMHEILPRNVYEDCMYARSTYLRLPDGHAPLNPIFCTMGNGFCFALETAVFLAIARAAVKSWCHFTGIEWNEDFCWAYGDDIIVLAAAYEYVVEWLQLLDFTVNTDKSFTAGDSFRESCGFDWFDGEYMSSIYWPRQVVTEHMKSVSYLVSLQNRLFERGAGYFYYEAYSFLCDQVHRIAPRLSEVPLDVFLEYNLEGLCLVTHTAPQPEVQHYRYTDSANFERIVTYEEDRIYVNLLHTKPEEGFVNGGQRIENFLYYCFLRKGPKYDDDISQLLGVSTSYRDKSLRQKSGDVVVTKRRLI